VVNESGSPAGLSISGDPLPTPWGVQIPGCDFGNPIATAVQSPMVVLMATEPSADTLDSHASLGILPLDAPACMVTCDPQDAIHEVRPLFPKRMVAGSLPLAPVGLAAGASLAATALVFGGIGIAFLVISRDEMASAILKAFRRRAKR